MSSLVPSKENPLILTSEVEPLILTNEIKKEKSPVAKKINENLSPAVRKIVAENNIEYSHQSIKNEDLKKLIKDYE